ncbi:hypothetical protein ACH47B_34555 [Rhodococcus sp. NPDC019627]
MSTSRGERPTFVFEVAGPGTVAVPTDLWAPGEDVPPTRQEFTDA